MSKHIAVFCGSSLGTSPAYAHEAAMLGRLLAERDISLVYGGGKAGLMGIVADSVLENGGKVIGVIPEFLNTRERKHENLTQQIEVQTMHQRKTIMYEMSDAAIALPGGFGTLDEFFEIITWNQLTLHSKMVGLLNVNNFYEHLYQHMLRARDHAFAPHTQIENLRMANSAEDLLSLMI
jgi:uncharacterized protein (TIGR00730 family)